MPLHRKSWGNHGEIYLIHTFTSKALAIMLAKKTPSVHQLFFCDDLYRLGDEHPTRTRLVCIYGCPSGMRVKCFKHRNYGELCCIKRHRTSSIDSIKGKRHHTYHTPFSKRVVHNETNAQPPNLSSVPG